MNEDKCCFKKSAVGSTNEAKFQYNLYRVVELS